MHDIVNAILNLLLVSIPEEIVWVSLSLIMIGRFDLLDWRRLKRNIKYLIIPIISTAFIINLFMYIIVIPKPFKLLATITVFITTMIILQKKTLKIREDKLVIKTIIWSIISFIVSIIIPETTYIPLTSFIANVSIKYYNTNVFIGFLMSLPARALEIMIIFLLVYYKNINIKVSFLNNLIKDKIAGTIVSIVIICILVLWSALSVVLINYNRTLDYNIYQQLAISLVILIVPTGLLGLIIMLVYHYIKTLQQLQKSHQNMFDDEI